jgi:NADPH:quinone reductase-like Zn-dependent oxidoreductase
MRAIRLHEVGGPTNLRVETVDDPTPAAGEIRVRITRAAMNRRDVYITQGLYPGIKLPCILGSDGVGTVDALGEGAQGPAIGTRVVIDPTVNWGASERSWQRDGHVLGMPEPGTFAEFVCVKAASVHPAPASLSDDEAAAIPLAGITAYRALVSRGQCTKDDVVLIPGIGSGVQTTALIFAKKIGAKVVVTSSSDEKLAAAKALGADVGINYKTSEKWEKDVQAIDGGPSLVIDSVGGETFAKALNIARYGARIVMYGGTTGDAKVRPFSIFWKQLDILGTSMGSPADFTNMLKMWDGSIKPVVDSVIEMDDIVAAAEKLDKNEAQGKIVLKIA